MALTRSERNRNQGETSSVPGTVRRRVPVSGADDLEEEMRKMQRKMENAGENLQFHLILTSQRTDE